MKAKIEGDPLVCVQSRLFFFLRLSIRFYWNLLITEWIFSICHLNWQEIRKFINWKYRHDNVEIDLLLQLIFSIFFHPTGKSIGILCMGLFPAINNTFLSFPLTKSYNEINNTILLLSHYINYFFYYYSSCIWNTSLVVSFKLHELNTQIYNNNNSWNIESTTLLFIKHSENNTMHDSINSLWQLAIT